MRTCEHVCKIWGLLPLTIYGSELTEVQEFSIYFEKDLPISDGERAIVDNMPKGGEGGGSTAGRFMSDTDHRKGLTLTMCSLERRNFHLFHEEGQEEND